VRRLIDAPHGVRHLDEVRAGRQIPLDSASVIGRRSSQPVSRGWRRFPPSPRLERDEAMRTDVSRRRPAALPPTYIDAAELPTIDPRITRPMACRRSPRQAMMRIAAESSTGTSGGAECAFERNDWRIQLAVWCRCVRFLLEWRTDPSPKPCERRESRRQDRRCSPISPRAFRGAPLGAAGGHRRIAVTGRPAAAAVAQRDGCSSGEVLARGPASRTRADAS
jgi:hypothetical protein